MSKLMKVLILTSSMALGACTTSYVQDHLLTTDKKRTQIYDQDNMIAIGILKQKDNSTDMLFLGEKYSYIINSGGTELLNIIQGIPAEKRILMTHPPIPFNFKDHTQFTGMLQLRYSTPLDQISHEQRAYLEKLGFNREIVLRESDGGRNTYLYTSIVFSGTQYQAVSSSLIQHKMSQPYPIRISKTIFETEEKNKAQKLAGILLMPIAIGVDLVTLPVTIGVIGYELTHKDAFK